MMKIAKRAKKIQSLADLTEMPGNPRKHTEYSTAYLEKSLENYGAARSVVIMGLKPKLVKDV